MWSALRVRINLLPMTGIITTCQKIVKTRFQKYRFIRHGLENVAKFCAEKRVLSCGEGGIYIQRHR